MMRGSNRGISIGALLLTSISSEIHSFAPKTPTIQKQYSPNKSCLFSSSTANKKDKSAATAKHSSKKRDASSSNTIIPTARYLAVAALASGSAGTTDSSAFASRRLDADVRYTQLEPRDRAFARLLVATVERRLGQIDSVLTSCIDKYPPKGKHANIVQATLRIGVAQLFFLNTPPHAATSDTVQVLRMHHNLVSSKKSFPVPEPMIRFVNGVLRKLSRPLESGIMHGQTLLENTSANDNIAPWLLQRWKEDWGETRTKLICQEMMPGIDAISSRIDVTTKYSLKSVVEDVPSSAKEVLDEIRQEFGNDCTLLPHGSLRVGSSLPGDVSQWPGYNNGTWWVQDASSTLPALVLTQALSKRHEDLNSLHVIDMCSAPGGKACQLLSAGFGRVTAIEASQRRSKRLIENLNRLNFLSDKCEVIVEQGQNYLPAENVCIDGILVDVPCSATGTGARQPDVVRRSITDLKELLEIQKLLSNHCANNILRPGGIMVYATCSILKAESEEQVAALLAGNRSMRTLPIEPNEVPGFEGAIDENGWLRVLPGVLEGDLKSTDGFFVARLIKDEVVQVE